ncbi:hypothetical protein AB0K14_09995 [Actinosynnema sp. NPDC050801]|jgi:hypothetical protein|uniref:hypothetical protein n=1 Tax=unclassified Actinosynnema TaxID=2637065 RepID=UPI00340E1753
MTYPQQPFGGHEPSDRFPRPTPPPGQQGPPFGYGTPEHGGFGAPPPPKRNTGAVVAVVALVVLVLGGIGFTGFVAPGFFLAEGGTGGSSTTPVPRTSSSVPPGADPERLVGAVVEALGSQDTDFLKGVACAEAGSAVHKVIDDVAPFRGAEPVGSPKTSADEAVGTFEVATAWKTEKFQVEVVRDGGTWCWHNIARADVGKTSAKPTSSTAAPTAPGTPTAGGKPVDPAGLETLRTFVDNLNAGNAAEAKAQLCADAIKKPRHVDELIGYEPDLAVDSTKDGITSGPGSFQLYVRGTAKGQKIDGSSGSVWVTNFDGPWCVHAFTVVVI